MADDRVQYSDVDEEDDDDFFMASNTDDDEVDSRLQEQAIIVSAAEESLQSEGAGSDNTSVDGSGSLTEHKDVIEIVSSQSSTDMQHKRARNSNSSSEESEYEPSRRISLSSSPVQEQQRSKRVKEALVEDDTDIFLEELAREARRTPSVTVEPMPDEHSKRVYNVRFTSKLDGTIDKTVQVKAMGRTQFNSILPTALDRFMKEYNLPTIMKKIYSVANVIPYWNNAKLLGFMTCNSLKLPQSFENERTDVEVIIISKDDEEAYAQELQKQLQQAEEFKEETNSLETGENTEVIEEFEKELKELESVPVSNDLLSDTTKEENSSPIIQITLLGEDNKKITAHVRGSTPFKKLAEYYVSQKRLPASSKIVLVFDNDELDPNDTIQSQDMEDEDIIEVLVK